MEPPICDVSDERFDPADGGRRIRFLPTDAGRRFERRVAEEGAVGDHPDEGWFSAPFADAADALRATHTRPEAIRTLRGDPPAATDPPIDPVRADLERRQRTRVQHELPEATPRDTVRTAMRLTLDDALSSLRLDTVEPEVRREQHRSPSPEPRDAIQTTSIETRETWRSPDHEVSFAYRDIRWDSWSGMPRGGDLLQGTITLTIDDTWLFASFGADGLVSELSESGERSSEAARLLSQLLDLLRDP